MTTMSRAHPGLSRAAAQLRITPMNMLIAAGTAAVLAVVHDMTLGDTAIPLRVLLIVAALLLALAGACRRVRDAGPEVEERASAAGYLALAGFVGLLARLACDESWDTFRLLIAVASGAGLGAAVLLLLPQAVRRGVIVLAVVVHFGGILTAVCSVPPPNAQGSWLANYSWITFYRPYLQFMYLNNAYHFYSPEPGPPTLMWLRIQYADGTYRWVKIPNREDYATRLEYQRRLALTESINQIDPVAPGLEWEQRVAARRRQALIGSRGTPPIPLYPDTAEGLQFRPPNLYSKIMLATYSRYVATDPEYRHPTDPEQAVVGVKVYRVIHNLVGPQQMAEGLSPTAETTYVPYYMGEFHWAETTDPESGETDRKWTLKDPNDPLLYWVIPILAEPKHEAGAFRVGDASEYVIKDYLAVHAGDKKQP
jgi:hypothetical protein